jgi:hypothetical protein
VTDRLFEQSFYGTWQNVLRSAAIEVRSIDRRVFSSPELAGHLQRITEKYSLDVARIKPDAVEATGREEEIQSRDYGRNFISKRKVLDIVIPFSGESQSFKLSPSQTSLLSHRLTLGNESLTFTISDDANADREVKTVVDQLTQNLERLRSEYEQAKPQLEATIQQAASSRKAEIAGEDERDKGRSFKVKR